MIGDHVFAARLAFGNVCKHCGVARSEHAYRPDAFKEAEAMDAAKREPAVYLRLFHGRRTLTEEMNDWGEDGPILGPLSFVHTTYGGVIHLGDPNFPWGYAGRPERARWTGLLQWHVLRGLERVCSGNGGWVLRWGTPDAGREQDPRTQSTPKHANRLTRQQGGEGDR